MHDPNCKYCTENHDLTSIAIYICDLSVSKLYLFKEQSFPGRCLLAYANHVNELHDLSEEEIAQYAVDIRRTGNVIRELYHPDKINYGMYNDTGSHLHCHIVPKYRGSFMFGDLICMIPEHPVYLDEQTYAKTVEAFRAWLK